MTIEKGREAGGRRLHWRRAMLLRQDTLPSTTPAGAASHQSYQQQQHNGSDRRVDNSANDAGAQMNTNSRQQPASDERADNSDQEITDQPEACSSNNLSGQPTRYNADQQNDQETFTRHVHGVSCIASGGLAP